MAIRLAQHTPGMGLAMNAGFALFQDSADAMFGGPPRRRDERAARPQPAPGSPATSIAEALASLEALPWLTLSGPDVSAAREDGGLSRPGHGRPVLLAGIAAALAVVGGGAWYLEVGSAAPPAPAAQQAGRPSGSTGLAPSAAANVRSADRDDTAGTGAQQTLVAGQNGSALQADPNVQSGAQPSLEPRSEPRSGTGRMKPMAATRTPPAMPDGTASPATGQATLADAGSLAAPAPAPDADPQATAATLKEYKASVEECRDAIRDVIRLGKRQRPGRDATVQEQANYLLRQQNAEAAKGYRAYLDTLARSMRGTRSPEVARQGLARARETLSYVKAMLADSQASLR